MWKSQTGRWRAEITVTRISKYERISERDDMDIPIIGQNKLPHGHPFEPVESSVEAAIICLRDAFRGMTCINPDLMKQGIIMLQQADIMCVSAYVHNITSLKGEDKAQAIKTAKALGEGYRKDLMKEVAKLYPDEPILTGGDNGQG
jgi:hypothetical protein